MIEAEGLGLGLVATAFFFGLRHGIDWDHIAAIGDITSSQTEGRRSMYFATLYALGHGAVVFVLGGAAVLAGDLLPTSVDSVLEPVVGATLVALGIYVFYSLIRHGRDFRMRSRWMLVFAGFRRLVRWVTRRRSHPIEVEIEHDHEHTVDPLHDHAHAREVAAGSGSVITASKTHRHVHRHRAVMPDDPFAEYGTWTAVGVGMIHGVGAETPTQLLIYFAALGVGGALGGMLLLAAFVVGLLVANTLIALAATYGFLRAGGSFKVYATIAVTTGAFSLVLGCVYLLGEGAALPALFAG